MINTSSSWNSIKLNICFFCMKIFSGGKLNLRCRFNSAWNHFFFLIICEFFKYRDSVQLLYGISSKLTKITWSRFIWLKHLNAVLPHGCSQRMNTMKLYAYLYTHSHMYVCVCICMFDNRCYRVYLRCNLRFEKKKKKQ